MSGQKYLLRSMKNEVNWMENQGDNLYKIIQNGQMINFG